jgi:hypothetical protein
MGMIETNQIHSFDVFFNVPQLLWNLNALTWPTWVKLGNHLLFFLFFIRKKFCCCGCMVYSFWRHLQINKWKNSKRRNKNGKYYQVLNCGYWSLLSNYLAIVSGSFRPTDTNIYYPWSCFVFCLDIKKNKGLVKEWS